MKKNSSIFNFYLLDFALKSVWRQKQKNIFIVVVFSLLVFIISSIFQISNGLRNEALSTVSSLPEITVQQIENGRMAQINNNKIDELLQIDGISYVNTRIWGYYYFPNKDVYFTIVGIDQFEEQYKSIWKKISSKHNFYDMNNSVIIGSGVSKLLKESYFDSSFNFILKDGKTKHVEILDTFDRDTTLETNDIILMSKTLAYEILDVNKTMATDIVVKVKNINEIGPIATKIKNLYPDCKVTTRDDLKRSYEQMFNYKSGIFLALFVISLFTFFIIIYDRSSTLLSEEKQEIGILKAVGWSTNDILKWKFYESSIISVFSFCFGLILSFLYVYIFKAPLLKDLFLGFSNMKPDFNLPFVLNLELIIIIFLICVPIYIAATIFPSWRASLREADEVLR